MNLNILELFEISEGIDLYGDNRKTIGNIVTDSRKAGAGDIFIALKGETVDGHDYIKSAAENGCAAFIINAEKYQNLKEVIKENIPNCSFLTVHDTKKTLLDIAKYIKNTINPKTVAVTGSVGKTTTKEFIYSVLKSKHKTQKNEGNYNNNIGVPLTLFGLCEDTEILIQEMGMNNFGEIDVLSRTVSPDVAVITNIGTSHIGNLGSREGIKKAKLEILNGIKPDGTIIMNGDEPLLYEEKGRTGKTEIFFGIENKNCDITAENITSDYGSDRSKFDIIYKNNRIPDVKIPVLGRHNVYNALVAFAAGKLFCYSDAEIKNGLNDFQGQKMRQNIYNVNDITIIEDCYNASLESITVALELLSGMGKHKNIPTAAVLGDVLETGGFDTYIHTKIGEAIINNKPSSVYLYGEKSKITYDFLLDSGYTESLYHFFDKELLLEKLNASVKSELVILFKASRGMKLETVIEKFKQ